MAHDAETDAYMSDEEITLEQFVLEHSAQVVAFVGFYARHHAETPVTYPATFSRADWDDQLATFVVLANEGLLDRAG